MKKVILFSKLLYLNVFAKPTIKTTYCKCCYNKEIDPQSIIDDMNNNNNNGNNNTNIDNNNNNNDDIGNNNNNNNNIDNNDENKNDIDNNNDNNDDIDNNDENKDGNGNNIEDKKDYKEDNIYSDNANSNEISYISNSEVIEDLDSKENVAKDNNNNNNNGNIYNKDDEINKIIDNVNIIIGWAIDAINNIDKFNILKKTDHYKTTYIMSLKENIYNFHTDINAILDSIKNIYKIDNNEIENLNNLIEYFNNLKKVNLLSKNYNEELNSILDKIKNDKNFQDNLENECNNILKIINDYEANIVNKFKILYNLFTGKNYISEDKDVNKLIEILNIGKNNIFNDNIKNFIHKYNTIEKNNKILFNNLQNNIVTEGITLKEAISNLDNYIKENKDIDEITKDYNYYININNIYNNSSKVLDLNTFSFKKIKFDSIINNTGEYFNKYIKEQNNNQYLFAVKNIKKSINNNKNIDCNNLFLFIYKTLKDEKNYYHNHLFKYTDEGYLHVDSFNYTIKHKNKKEENFLLNENKNDINLIDKVKSYFENKKKSSNKHMKSKTTNLKKNNK